MMMIEGRGRGKQMGGSSRCGNPGKGLALREWTKSNFRIFSRHSDA